MAQKSKDTGIPVRTGSRGSKSSGKGKGSPRVGRPNGKSIIVDTGQSESDTDSTSTPSDSPAKDKLDKLRRAKDVAQEPGKCLFKSSINYWLIQWYDYLCVQIV